MLADLSIDLMKIDVEGHEASVISGARNAIESSKPYVLCEVLPSEIRDGSVFKWFRAQGYLCFGIHEEEEKAKPYHYPDPTRRGVTNYLFLHESKWEKAAADLDFLSDGNAA